MTTTVPRTFEGPAPREVLFEPYRLPGGLLLPNRILLAPCTRNRATADLSVTPGAVGYYAERAKAGLLITEASVISPEAQGYVDTPGIFRDTHVRAWAAVTEGVHKAGGRIFLQLWHTGRMGHSHWSGMQPLAPSAVLDPNARRQTRGLQLFHEMPREMTEADIGKAIADYAAAASRAIQAGFEGIEIHGANGYLPEQFMRRHTNRRTDAWGGSPERHSRFTLDVVDACSAAIGAARVGLRLSPAAYFSEMQWTQGDNENYLCLMGELAKRPICYLHSGIVDDDPYDYLGCTSTEFLRRHWRGTLIGNGAYTPDAAASHIAAGAYDLIAFGRLFIANPDLVDRIAARAPLKEYSRPLLDLLT